MNVYRSPLSEPISRERNTEPADAAPFAHMETPNMLTICIPSPRTELEFRVWSIHLAGKTLHVASSLAEAEGYVAGHLDRIAGYGLLGPRVESFNPYISHYRAGYMAGSRG